MNSRATVLYQSENHLCLSFSDLVKGEGIQSNQFLIIDNDRVALIDPGGDLTYAPLTVEIGKVASMENLDYIFASHQDPDIIASLPKWLMKSSATVISSRLWSRFLPHLIPGYMSGQAGLNMDERVVGIADRGDVFTLGESDIVIIPAHFLHSVGNFHFFDVKSNILFSGDLGASLVEEGEAYEAVKDFDNHIPKMEGFHRRYMTSNRACRLWAKEVKKLKPSKIVPQHGPYFEGEQVDAFLNWIANLECGVDLIDEQFYKPRSVKRLDNLVGAV